MTKNSQSPVASSRHVALARHVPSRFGLLVGKVDWEGDEEMNCITYVTAYTKTCERSV